MSANKGARAKMNGTINKALNEGDCLRANEISANVMVGTTIMIKDDIYKFVDGAEQFDDITVMAMKIN